MVKEKLIGLSFRLVLMLCMVAAAVLPGCEKLMQPSIVGKWKADAGNTIEFFPDGTLQDSGALNTSNGTYTLLEGNRIKTDIEGVLWGSTVTTWKYSVDGDKLTLTTEGGVGLSFEFTRVD